MVVINEPFDTIHTPLGLTKGHFLINDYSKPGYRTEKSILVS